MNEKTNNTMVNFDASDISISEFINTKYREYWEYSNKNGKNAIDANEQLPEVVRKIIYSAYTLGIKPSDERKTIELAGQVVKYHPHGDSSIQESIKGVATAYKSQPAARLLHGIGNFGAAPGDDGAAARYTSIGGTPLLSAIYKDIPFVPFDTDDTGLEQPEYISCPLPMNLINGASAIGTGKSCFLAERDAHEIIDWIDALRLYDWSVEKAAANGYSEPKPMSVTGCDTWFEPKNGYVYYQAIVHENVNHNDLNKKGRVDIITALPPKCNAMNTITKLQNKLPSRITNKIIDGSGEGRPTWIIVPSGYLKEDDYAKYGMRTARKEQIYIWDHKANTMRKADIVTIAKEWFEDRSKIVKKRLNEQKIKVEANNHKINLIKIFSENDMINWKSEDVINYFIKLANENDYHGYEIDENHNLIKLTCEEAGTKDANMILSLSARTFLPENVAANEVTRKKNDEQIKELNDEIKNVGDVVIREARDIIEAQERFFKSVEND